MVGGENVKGTVSKAVVMEDTILTGYCKRVSDVPELSEKPTRAERRKHDASVRTIEACRKTFAKAFSHCVKQSALFGEVPTVPRLVSCIDNKPFAGASARERKIMRGAKFNPPAEEKKEAESAEKAQPASEQAPPPRRDVKPFRPETGCGNGKTPESRACQKAFEAFANAIQEESRGEEEVARKLTLRYIRRSPDIRSASDLMEGGKIKDKVIAKANEILQKSSDGKLSVDFAMIQNMRSAREEGTWNGKQLDAEPADDETPASAPVEKKVDPGMIAIGRRRVEVAGGISAATGSLPVDSALQDQGSQGIDTLGAAVDVRAFIAQFFDGGGQGKGAGDSKFDPYASIGYRWQMMKSFSVAGNPPIITTVAPAHSLVLGGGVAYGVHPNVALLGGLYYEHLWARGMDGINGGADGKGDLSAHGLGLSLGVRYMFHKNVGVEAGLEATKYFTIGRSAPVGEGYTVGNDIGGSKILGRAGIVIGF